MRYLTRSRILGVGMTPLGKSGLSASRLMQSALELALGNASVRLSEVDGIVAVPSLSEPRFMEAHFIATQMGLLPHRGVIARTIDTGGAGPISALLEADKMIRFQGCDLVAVVAGDAVSSLPTEEFLRRADAGCNDPEKSIPSPVIPNGYNRIAQWHIDTGHVTREQLAMTAVLMSRQAVRHPYALTKKAVTLDEVLNSPQIGSVTSRLECARRADGAAALVVASTRFMQERGLLGGSVKAPVIVGGGEASGPLYPPKIIDEEMFSCEQAVKAAFDVAQVSRNDLQFFGLYDCFPICLVRAVEAVGLAERGQGGRYIEAMYELSERQGGALAPSQFPVNTHGGLLAFGAPWEVPAMYNVIEAVKQLNGTVENAERQVPECKRALVYGNGGIFSASAVAVLGSGDY